MTCIDVTLPPITGSRPLLLVAAAALDRCRIACCWPSARRKSDGGLVGISGRQGRHADETPEAALVRELHEELGIETSVGCLWPLTFASHAYEKFHLLMPLFSCRVWTGEPQPREGQKLAWATKQELKTYDMPPADKPLVESLWHLL